MPTIVKQVNDNQNLIKISKKILKKFQILFDKTENKLFL